MIFCGKIQNFNHSAAQKSIQFLVERCPKNLAATVRRTRRHLNLFAKRFRRLFYVDLNDTKSKTEPSREHTKKARKEIHYIGLSKSKRPLNKQASRSKREKFLQRRQSYLQN
jgi:hypothetical protein